MCDFRISWEDEFKFLFVVVHDGLQALRLFLGLGVLAHFRKCIRKILY